MSIFPSKKQSCSERDFQNQTKIAVSMKLLGGGGGYLLVKGYWGCAAGWGHIFTTGLTIIGLHF